ncbi:hypothetical protein Aph01nite_00840 [Acrocarpospora phusangensis]|uniref:Uncharacterized protein n=1 Tax=Acrocarpospora phusangensis TaxID=1070424 RepID=A0A919Q5T8_9ACTN|nr:hypothetical protein Aph01nite_00840 [Acrocarpospora phusangensis]
MTVYALLIREVATDTSRLPTRAPANAPTPDLPGPSGAEPDPPVNGASWWALGHPRRSAVTTVRIAQATQADLAVLQGVDLSEGETPVKVTMTIEVSADPADPIVEEVRTGGMQAYELFEYGHGSLYPETTRNDLRAGLDSAITLRFAGGQTSATVATRWTYLGTVANSAALELNYFAPYPPSRLRTYGGPAIDAHTVRIVADGWDIAGVTGQTPTSQADHQMELRGQSDFQVALTRTGHNPYVELFLPDTAEDEDTEEGVEWNTVAVWSAVAALLIAAGCGVRALGRTWWRDRRNHLLVAVTAAVSGGVAAVAAQAEPSLLPGAPNRVLSAAWTTLARRSWEDLSALALWTSVGLVLLALPALLVSHTIKRRGQMPWSSWALRDLVVTLAIVPAILLVVSARVEDGPEYAPWLALALLCPVGAAVLAEPTRMPDSYLRATVAIAAALSCLALLVFTRNLLIGLYPAVWVIGLVFAVLWSPIAIAGVALAVGRWSRPHALLSLAATVVIFVWPISRSDSTPYLSADDAKAVLFSLVVQSLGLLVLLVCLLMLLRLFRLGRSPGAIVAREPYATVAGILVVAYMVGNGGDELAALVAFASMVWLTTGAPARRSNEQATKLATELATEPAIELAEVSPAEHRRLVRSALRLRLLRASEEDLFRTSGARLAGGEMTVSELDGKARELEEAIARREEGLDPDLAFATSGGRTPAANGLTAAAVALVLTLPLTITQGLENTGLSIQEMYNSRFLIALPAFGLVYGYFYPRIRGELPITKGLFLMVAALVTELSSYLPSLTDGSTDLADRLYVIAIVLGNTAILGLGLGLFWEWRLMRLAGEPWSRIRNVRNVRSLTAPLAAILIAAGTAAATSLAGAAATEIFQSPSAEQTTGQTGGQTGPPGQTAPSPRP